MQGGARLNGVGDIVQGLFFSPAGGGQLTWGVGPVQLLPTASRDGLGAGKYGLGPTGVVVWANHIWSLSGGDDRPDLNATFVQPFASYTLGGGTTVGISSETTGRLPREMPGRSRCRRR